SSTQLACARSAQAARSEISGPMPAGSPVVTARVGRAAVAMRLLVVAAELDVGAVAHLARPVLGRFLQLAVADHLARLVARALLRRIVALALEDLDQVEAERRLDHAAHLARL